MSKQYEEFWKYHNKDNMDVHAVELIEELEAENNRLKGIARRKCDCGNIINHDYCTKCIKDWAS